MSHRFKYNHDVRSVYLVYGWLVENMDGPDYEYVEVYDYQNGYFDRIYFRNESDYMMFKLRYGV